VLDGGFEPLVIAMLALFLSRPIKSSRALGLAFQLSGPGLKQKVRHIAYWLEAAWLVRRMEQLQIDHLHAHFGTNPAAVAAIVRAWGGPPFSFTVHGPDEFDAPITLSLSRKIEAASFVAGISSYGRSQLMRWCQPEHWSKIELIRCGLGADFLDAPAEAPRADSSEFVCVARLSAQKGLPLLIAACDRLHAAGERFSVTLIGEGELRTSLERDIRQRGLEDKIALAGIRSSSEIRKHLLRARCFVLPSFAEGLPVVLMEALALSRPVIATSIAGIPELVDTECGWVIPAGSEDALVAAMTQALHAAPEDLAAKGKIGRERVHRMHDAGVNAAVLTEAILSSSRKQPA
jgi:glycosyltransferase involved in cell wall biosynthesis